jgi:hypothetical protein
LPAATRALYLEAFTAALHPVFLDAAAIALLAFALTWFLREVPLRGRAAPAASRVAVPSPYSEGS